MNARIGVSVVVLLLLTSGTSGCERENSTTRDSPSRFARRYMPFEPAWIPESEIPAGPPSEAQMVVWEVSTFDPRIPATPDQQVAADAFVKRCFEVAVAKHWFDRETGMADGFLTAGSDSRHHRNDEYVLDGIQLDPERPEYLMYYPDPNRDGEQALAGIMFLADGAETHGQPFAGPLAIWHYHKYMNARCWASQGLLSTGMVDGDGRCTTGGVPIHRSPEMVHVWLIELPGGPFSTGMTVPQIVLRDGLAKRRAELGF